MRCRPVVGDVMSAWVKLGAKCVCIRVPKPSGFTPGARGLCSLVKGAVYTVNDILDKGYIGLEEVHQSVCVDADLFRPVTPARSVQDDVSLFHHHLKSVGEDA